MSKYHILLFDSERITQVICYVQQCSIAIFITNDLKYVRIARGTLKVNTLSMIYKKQLIRNICYFARKLGNKAYAARKN